MNKDLLAQAQEARQQIWDQLQVVMYSDNLTAVERAWQQMLNLAARIYEKLKLAAETPQEKAWWGLEVKARKEEPVLRYAHHARNADHHGIKRVTARSAGGYGITGDGEIRNVRVTGEGLAYEMVPGKPAATVVAIAPSVELVPVTDRGVEYAVPDKFLGQDITDRSLYKIAIYLEMMMRGLVRQAEHEAGKSAS